MSKPCTCPLAGFCDRHNRLKSARMHELCSTREDYRDLWDRQAVEAALEEGGVLPAALAESTKRGIDRSKPRVDKGNMGSWMAQRRANCQEKKAQGLPCPDDKATARLEPTKLDHFPKETVLIPPPAKVVWSVGVTTVASRRHTYLPKTLEALARGGFTSLRLFVDGDADHEGWAEQFKGHQIRCRPQQLGVVGAWIGSLTELYLASPRADRYALFQDDLTCSAHLRQYLERSGYPHRGYLNLYTFTAGNEAVVRGKPVGWHEACLVNPPDRNPNLYQAGRGAVALVFDNEAVRAALSSPGLWHKPSSPDLGHTSGRIKIDGALVTCMNNAGFREYIHNPSLVQHAGFESSRPEAQDPNSGAYRYGHMQAQTYRGDGFDLLTLLEKKS